VLGGNFGDFVVREGTKPGTCVIVINDSGIIANLQVKINTGNGNCTLAGQNFQGMDEVIDYLRANPQNSKKEGSPKYVAQPTLRGLLLLFGGGRAPPGILGKPAFCSRSCRLDGPAMRNGSR